jgi:hypothetical protein
VSYASSSSQSFRMGGELSPHSIVSPISEAGSSSSYVKLSHKCVSLIIFLPRISCCSAIGCRDRISAERTSCG